MTSTNQPTNELSNKRTKLLTMFLTFLLTCALFFSQTALAVDFAGSLKGVTITDSAGTNTPPTAVINFTRNGNIVNFDASGSTYNGSIVEYRWDFGDGVIGTGVRVIHTYSTSGDYPVTLAVVNGGEVDLVQRSVVVTIPFEISVNFQPVGAPVPFGYKKDSGELFDSAKGYGWLIKPADTRTIDYNADISSGQEYDTIINMPTMNGVWEVAVENGDYNVAVCMGDPVYPIGVVAAQAEGITVIGNKVLSSDNRWIERTVNVTVLDGRLTVTFEGSGARRRLCWIKINQL